MGSLTDTAAKQMLSASPTAWPTAALGRSIHVKPRSDAAVTAWEEGSLLGGRTIDSALAASRKRWPSGISVSGIRRSLRADEPQKPGWLEPSRGRPKWESASAGWA